MSRFPGAVLTLLLTFIALPNASMASEILPAEVCQPLNLYEGLIISRVTYLSYRGSQDGLVNLTCAADTLRDPMTGRQRQFNAAYAAKLDVRETTSLGDTLAVELDTSRMVGFVQATGSRDSMAVVRATIECIKANAGAPRRGFTFLRLDVTGHRVYRVLSGVFSLAEYRCGPTQWESFESPRSRR